MGIPAGVTPQFPVGTTSPTTVPGAAPQPNPKLAQLKALFDAFIKANGMPKSGAQNPLISPAVIPNGPLTPIQSVPQQKALTASGGTPVQTSGFKPQSIYRDMPSPQSSGFEFNTKQGRDAAVVHDAISNLINVTNSIKQKKAQARANTANMYVSMYLDAEKRGDIKMMNWIAEDPKAQKSLEKAFGMSLPNPGKVQEKKPKKPEPETAGAVQAIKQRTAMPIPQPTTQDVAASSQARTQQLVNQAAQKQMQNPQIASQVGRQALTGSVLQPSQQLDSALFKAGLKISPVMAQQMSLQTKIATLKALETLSQIQSKESIATQTNAARVQSAKISGAARTQAAETEAAGRVESAKISGQFRAAIQSGDNSKAVKTLLDGATSYMNMVKAAVARGDKNSADVDSYFKSAQQLMQAASQLGQANAATKAGQELDQLGAQMGIK